MSSVETIRTVEAAGISLHLLDELFGRDAVYDVAVRLWDGTLWPDEQLRPVTLALNHPGALRQMFLPGTELALAEAYLYNDYDIQGEIEKIFDLADILIQRTKTLGKKLRVARELLRLPDGDRRDFGDRGPARLSGLRHSIERDKQAVRYHYDVSNDFYKLFLDQRLVYSCAYFLSPDEDLDTAQERKLDTICRKLRLRPGQRLLDIGCGWGGLMIYAAENYGVDVTGITLSQPQADLANQRIQEKGLSQQCRVFMRDYREMEADRPFNALVSVGMFEHVGEGLLPEYFKKAWQLLEPGGVFLNHGIARRITDVVDPVPGFSDTYVFPDGELEPISTTLAAAETTGFEVRDVESLREHYSLTLRHWIHQLECHHEQALRYVDEPTYRVWRLYMSGSIHEFNRGRQNLYQTLFAKPEPNGESHLPLSRRDWYL
jgi:cyclopropane-fatty-acyl-phospholipid synthase